MKAYFRWPQLQEGVPTWYCTETNCAYQWGPKGVISVPCSQRLSAILTTPGKIHDKVLRDLKWRVFTTYAEVETARPRKD